MAKLSTSEVQGGWPPIGVPVPTAELRHTLPDGSWHVDWLIARDAAARLPLITFRLPRPLAELAQGEEAVIERIGDHRPAYLTFEGEINGGRGEVVRIHEGSFVILHSSRRKRRLRVDWANETAPATFLEMSELAVAETPADQCVKARWQLKVIPATMAGEA